jgi:hypothetical protein
MAGLKEGRDGALQAEPSVAGSQGLLSEVEGLGFRTPSEQPFSPVWAIENCSRNRKITCDTIRQLR